MTPPTTVSRATYAEIISSAFSFLSEKIKTDNAAGLFNLNKLAEDIYIPVLNEIFDTEFVNTNNLQSGANYPAIDLISTQKRIGIQVTSDRTNKKVQKTVQKSIEHLSGKIDELHILIITEKSDRSSYKQEQFDKLINNGFRFDTASHIIDRFDIYKKIVGLPSIGKIEKVAKLLLKEFPQNSHLLESKYHIALSFAESDMNLVELITKKLSDEYINVYSNNNALKVRLGTNSRSKFLNIIQQDDLPEEVSLCFAIVSKNYVIDKLQAGKECNILLESYGKKIIFPLYIENDIPPISRFGIKKGWQKKFISPKANEIAEFIMNQLKATQNKFSGYEGLEKILKNSRSIGSLEEIIKEDNPKDKIGFQLFSDRDTLKGRTDYWLYLYNDINQTKSYDQFQRDLAKQGLDKLNTKDRLYVLIPKESHLINYEIRKKNIEDKFNPKKVYYIDEFIWNECTPPFFKQPTSEWLREPNFIYPRIKISGIEESSEFFITNWLFDDKSILVVKGMGGIGKTTLSLKLCDEFSSSDSSTSVLFINSNDIINELIKVHEREGKFDLYVFYEASCRSQESNDILDKEVFKHNLRNGKILIILDGLDEVFSKINTTFNIQELIDSINDYNGNIGQGKIIITCRDYFWNEDINLKENGKFESIEVLPFNSELSEEYFKKHFNNLSKKVEKCKSLAKEFSLSEASNSIALSPFIIQMICMIVEKDDNGKPDHTFHSDILKEDITTDKIFHSLLKREMKKLGQINVDSQVKFFTLFASTYNGITKQEEIGNILREVDNNITNQSIEAFKAHPLLERTSGSFRFRYDFNETYFKVIHLSSILDNKSFEIKEVDKTLISMLSRCSFNAEFTKDVCKRLNYENMQMNAIDIKEKLISKLRNDSTTQVKKAIGGLFNICLKTTHLRKSNSKEQNTKLLDDLFGVKRIEHLYINALPETEKIFFSFKDKQLFYSEIIDYAFLWECDFNEGSFFDETCVLKNINSSNIKATSITRLNFHRNIQHDGCIDEILGKQHESTSRKQEKITDSLEKFFKLFSKGNQFNQKSVEFLKPAFGRKNPNGKIGFDDIVDILEEENILERPKGTYDFLKIITNKETDIIKFCQESIISTELNNAIGKLLDS